MPNLTPPQSLDAERQVLGAIMKTGEMIEVASMLSDPSQFYSPKHRAIYTAALRLFTEGQAVDITTLSERMLADGTLSGIGGRVFLVDLVEDIVSTSHLRDHAKIVFERWLARKAIDLTNDVQQQCYEGAAPIDDVLAGLSTSVFALLGNRIGKGFVHISTEEEKYVERIEAYRSGLDIAGRVYSGFPSFDKKFLGAENSEYIVIGGFPSHGKTQVGLQWAIHAAEGFGKRVGINSLEMKHQAIFTRINAYRAQIDIHRLKSGQFSDAEAYRLKAAAKTTAQLPIYVDDNPGTNVVEILANCEKMHQQYGLDLLVVDYLQIIQGDKKKNRHLEVAEISEGLRRIARKMDIPVIALSQLTEGESVMRGPTGPEIRNLRESKDIAAHADSVVFVWHWQEQSGEMKSKLKIGKKRDGELGSVPMEFVSGWWFDGTDIGARKLKDSHGGHE